MAKLYFRYSAMNAGKSTAVMQVAHNYQERGMVAKILKPSTDTKAGDQISSRIGLTKKVDRLIKPEDDLEIILADLVCDCFLVDEAQFLNAEQVDQLRRIAITKNIPVICYGIRTDFLMKGFAGSTRLLEIAHSIEELKTICSCGKKALYNMRKLDGKPVFDGDQVAIEQGTTSYESVCGKCFVDHRTDHFT